MSGIPRLLSRVIEASWTGQLLRRPWGGVEERALRATGAVLSLASLALLAGLFMGLETPAALLVSRGLALIGLAAGISLALRPSLWMDSADRRPALHPLDLCAALVLGLLVLQSIVFAYHAYRIASGRPPSIGAAQSGDLPVRQAQARAAQDP